MANYFAEVGWDVTVLTVSQQAVDTIYDGKGGDSSLLDAIHPEVKVVRAEVATDYLVRDIRQYGSFRANFPRLHRQLYTKLYTFDRYTPWMAGLVAEATRQHLKKPFDVALATGGPWMSFATAATLRRTIGLPYVMDYRDSWTLEQFSGNPAFPAGHRAYTWEHRFLRGASKIVFVNEPMRRWHAERYPDTAAKMGVLENGYDAGLLAQDMFKEPKPGSPLRFGYLGTLTDRYETGNFWQGWTMAHAEPDLSDATAEMYGYVGFFGLPGQGCGLPGPEVPGTRIHGPVPKAEVTSVYRDLDALLFLVPNSPYVTSGKTYEYMATGKPIVAVHSADSAAAGPLSGYPLRATVVDDSPQAARDALLRAAQLARGMTREQAQAAQAYASNFERGRLLAPFEDSLRHLIHKQRRAA